MGFHTRSKMRLSVIIRLASILLLARLVGPAEADVVVQLLPDFNQTGQLADVRHLGDNPNDSRFIPPSPFGTSLTLTFDLPTDVDLSQISSARLLVDQYQADNSVLAQRSFVALNGQFLGPFSLNSHIEDLSSSTTLPVITDSFIVPPPLLLEAGNSLTVQAGDVGIGPPDTFDDLSVTNIILEVMIDNLPDLLGESFHFRVIADATGQDDGPLPFNALFFIEARIGNIGAGPATGFIVDFFATNEQIPFIDPGDEKLGSLTVGGIDPGQAIDVVSPLLQLPQHLDWSGPIWLGMIINPGGAMPEADTGNNSNQDFGLDFTLANLFDPLPPVVEIIGFQSEFSAKLYLRRRAFRRPRPKDPSPGWVRPLRPNIGITSPFDGLDRSGSNYRQEALIQPPGTGLTTPNSTFWILLRGDGPIAAPSPSGPWTFLAPEWDIYVHRWHMRFADQCAQFTACPIRTEFAGP